MQRLLRYCLLVVVRKIISMGTIIAIPAAKPTKPTGNGVEGAWSE